MRRLVQSCAAYIDAVCREADLRERGEILCLEEYRMLRRENIALRLCFSLFEYCFGFDLPDEVFSDPTFLRIFYGAVDTIALANVSKPKYPPKSRPSILTVRHSRMSTPTTWSKRARATHVQTSLLSS